MAIVLLIFLMTAFIGPKIVIGANKAEEIKVIRTGLLNSIEDVFVTLYSGYSIVFLILAHQPPIGIFLTAYLIWAGYCFFRIASSGAGKQSDEARNL